MVLPSTSTLSAVIPTTSAVTSLMKRNMGGQDDALIDRAAEAQIAEEGESENMFFTVLDYLARPQRAVAGVLHDMIDGGDFNPLDRVGQALIGEENYGVKDMIDIVSPGKWSNMKLPDWMGAKEVDPAKEVLGFLGDVFTDPWAGAFLRAAAAHGLALCRWV